MMGKYFNLRLFDDGTGAGAGTAGAGDGGQQQNAGTGGAYSFEQAEEIANARAQRAEKAALASYFKQQGMSESEVSDAIKAYKAQQAANRPDLDSIMRERDDALAEVAALRNSSTLRAKGVHDEDIDYVLFKVAALMREDDKLDFDKAAAKYLKENPRYAAGGSAYKVRTGTDGTQGGSPGNGGNAAINDAIRRAARR